MERSTLDMYLAMFLTNALGIVVYAALFAYSLKKKPHFWLRLVLGVLVLGGIATGGAFAMYFAIESGFAVTLTNMELSRMAANFIFLSLNLNLLGLCFDEKPSVILFVTSASAAAHILGSMLYEILIALVGVHSIFFSMYNGYNVWSFLAFYLCHAGVLVGVYFVFARSFARTVKVFDHALSRSMVGLYVIFAYVMVGIQGTNVYNSVFSGSDLPSVPLVFNGMIAIFCVFVLFVQRASLEWVRTVQEKADEQRVHENFRKQIELQQKNMELINIKCHDLKHQIRNLLAGQNLDEAFVEEVQSAISIYDARIRTGNDALDVLLTEKSLMCSVKHVQLTVMVEGEALDFMQVADINSFFGNAIDNAVEYLLTVEEDNRFVRITSVRKGDMLSIRVENYCRAELSFGKDGMPHTTKQDNGYHGFGTHSIRAVAEKYGGTATFRREDNLFILSALFVTDK